MINNIVNITIVINLIIIVYQDFRFRILDVKYAITLLLLCLWHNIQDPLLSYRDILLIITFIGLNLLFLVGYFSFKKRRFFNPIDKELGLGDIVFFIAVSPLFLLHQYILFFVSGLLLSLLLGLVTQFFSKKIKTLPLAGYLSFYLCSIFLINLMFDKAIFNLGSY